MPKLMNNASVPNPVTPSPSPVVPGSPKPRRGRSRTAIIIAVVAVALLAVVWWINHRQAQKAAWPGGPAGAGGRRGGGGPWAFNAPLPVGVRAAEKGDIHLYLDALGTITPLHTATIRSQISGVLQKVAFTEGQVVKAGDLLVVIDPRPYENALEQAEAQHQQAQSQLRTAQLDLERYETLAKEDSIAKQQLDTTRSQVSQYEAAVQSTQASIDTAKLNLTYCHITAPFDGRVGLRLVDAGNYITPGDSNGLVVLTQVRPISVVFTLPEDNVTPVAQRLHSGAKLPVEAFDRSQTRRIATGTLTTIDNQIDPTTGTFKLRAEFANEDESLFPNQFVNVRLLLDTLHDQTILPTSAIERGQQGPYVYMINDDQTATARPVTLGATEGERVAITSGVAVGDRVVVDGADRLKEGQRVIVHEAGGADANGSAAPGPNGQRRGGASGWGGQRGQGGGWGAGAGGQGGQRNQSGGWGQHRRDGQAGQSGQTPNAAGQSGQSSGESKPAPSGGTKE